jgi:hypothetical protein
MTAMKSLNFFSTFAIAATITIASSTAALSKTCYKISDPDGWVNLRDRESNQIITSIDTTQYVSVDGFDGESAILASPHGYLNLRESPKGKIIGRITNGTALLMLSEIESSWVRVLTPDGRVGYVYSVALEIYT